MSTETRVVDPLTGGEKGSKLARFSLIPSEWLWALAEHYGVGAKKYADRNWERGYAWHLSQDAHDRHYHQWLQGEDNDAETGSHHLIAAAWHLIALWVFQKRNLGTDDIRTIKTPSKVYGTIPFTGQAQSIQQDGVKQVKLDPYPFTS